MSSPRRQFISGKALTDALALMVAGNATAAEPLTVKWMAGDGTGDVPRITPNMALCIARGATYEGKFHKGRVYFIREIITRPAPVAEPEYWRDRAILRWDKSVDRKSVTLWDRILGSTHAAPVYSNIVVPASAPSASI